MDNRKKPDPLFNNALGNKILATLENVDGRDMSRRSQAVIAMALADTTQEAVHNKELVAKIVALVTRRLFVAPTPDQTGTNDKNATLHLYLSAIRENPEIGMEPIKAAMRTFDADTRKELVDMLRQMDKETKYASHEKAASTYSTTYSAMANKLAPESPGKVLASEVKSEAIPKPDAAPISTADLSKTTQAKTEQAEKKDPEEAPRTTPTIRGRG